MYKFILRRLIQSIPTFFGITILAYLLMSLTPGGPVAALAFNAGGRNPDVYAEIEARLGVNDPLPLQYLRWLTGDDWLRWGDDGNGNATNCFLITCDEDGDGINDHPAGDRKGIIRGDFGRSFANNRAVEDILSERVIPTLELSVMALIVSQILGIIVGVVSAVQKGKLFDNLARVFAVIVNAIPNFWLGLLLLYFLAFELDVFPLGGRCETTLDASCPPLWERLEYVVLPIFILAAGGVAGTSRFMRATMLDVVNQDYIRTARSKGLSSQRIWFGHALRNAMIPVIVGIGPAITGLLGGAVITETVFNYPGLGLTVVNAFTQRDYPIVMAVTIYAALATIIGFLISDILLAVVDPRIRL